MRRGRIAGMAVSVALLVCAILSVIAVSEPNALHSAFSELLLSSALAVVIFLLGVSVGRGVRSVTLRANAATLARLAPATSDVMASARVERHAVETVPDLADGELELGAISFVEAAEA